MNGNWAGAVIRDPEMQIRIHRSKHNRRIAPNGLTDHSLRLPEAQIHEADAVIRGRQWSLLSFRIENDPALESNQMPEIDHTQEPVKPRHLRAKVGSRILLCQWPSQPAIAGLYECRSVLKGNSPCDERARTIRVAVKEQRTIFIVIETPGGKLSDSQLCRSQKRELILRQPPRDPRQESVVMLFNSPIEVEQAQLGIWPVS